MDAVQANAVILANHECYLYVHIESLYYMVSITHKASPLNHNALPSHNNCEMIYELKETH